MNVAPGKLRGVKKTQDICRRVFSLRLILQEQASRRKPGNMLKYFSRLVGLESILGGVMLGGYNRAILFNI